MEEKRQKFFRRVGEVSVFLRGKVEGFMVVGSGALLACGVPMRDFPHDIDLEVKCSDVQWKVFEALAEAVGNDYYKRKEEDFALKTLYEKKPCIFSIKGYNDEDILLNVWKVKKFNHPCVYVNGIPYATVASVLEVKMMIGRKKDYRDLTYIIKNLTQIAIKCGNEDDIEEKY